MAKHTDVKDRAQFDDEGAKRRGDARARQVMNQQVNPQAGAGNAERDQRVVRGEKADGLDDDRNQQARKDAKGVKGEAGAIGASSLGVE